MQSTEVRWRVELLGGLRAVSGDRVLCRFRTQKTAALLAYLAYYRDRSHPREVLTELLWPEDNFDTGRHKLSVALSSLRRELEPSGIPDGAVLRTGRLQVSLNPSAVSSDSGVFEESVRQARMLRPGCARIEALANAVEEYRGPLLPGFYEDWIPAEQQRLETLYCGTVMELVEALEQSDQMERALEYAVRILSTETHRTEAHQILVRLFEASGRHQLADRQRRELARHLEVDLEEAAVLTPPLIGRSGSTSPTPGTGSSVVVGERRDVPLLEPIGGAMPLRSAYYITRPADTAFESAIDRGDSIVLLKGSTQVGKTSLLARGLQRARQAGARVIRTDIETLNEASLASPASLYLTLAQTIADQLELDEIPFAWTESFGGPNVTFQRFMRRQVLGSTAESIVWGVDGVDRLFHVPFGQEVFALFRSWHNERALEPDGPWSRLTLAIVYATEAHLFITDLNQSPFNVGTRLTLEDFSVEQVAQVNQCYGSPLTADVVTRFHALVGGHPWLVRRGLHEMVEKGLSLDELEARADSREWIFGNHLQRMLTLLSRDVELSTAIRDLLRGRPCISAQGFYRLRSAGLVVGEAIAEARLRCRLYEAYLRQHLPETR